ncbi:Transforming acidic coiled-coil-containing protein 1-like [Homarus americanus]|uniref:Transforming acidic coiled-coil-containing protein 1-like n=1 Tax=Homarus americanus TaxID=6706 RepID=A0A8J5JRR5_HOMAM|nr:Transforming acidic coiled-coil-containing protein 1-like [Homarus americanus]
MRLFRHGFTVVTLMVSMCVKGAHGGRTNSHVMPYVLAVGLGVVYIIVASYMSSWKRKRPKKTWSSSDLTTSITTTTSCCSQTQKAPLTHHSHSKLSGDEVVPVRDKKDHPAITPESPQNKPAPSTSSPAPPREERSAPEGTSSPTPRPSDTSEHKPSSSRPSSVPSEGYMTAAEVQELLKHQELKFEEKLLQVELTAGEKEKKLRQTMKDEQKELTNLGESMAELTQSRDALLKMVGQYKGMLAQLVSEKEKEKQSAEERIKALELERNQALEDLANVEVAFSDVHRANEEFKTMRKANDQEMTKMAALLKKAEMKIMSLQDSFDRKTRENQELTQLCDDLINKVGSSS